MKLSFLFAATSITPSCDKVVDELSGGTESISRTRRLAPTSSIRVRSNDNNEDTSLDYFGRFRNAELQKAYILSCLKQKSPLSFVSLTALIAGWAIAETTAALSLYSGEGSKELGFAISSFVSIGLCLFFCFCIYFLSRGKNITKSEKIQFYHSYLQVCFILSVTWLFILKLIEQNVFNAAACRPHFSTQFTPPSTTTTTTFPPPTATFPPATNFSPPKNCAQPDSFEAIVSFPMIIMLSFSPFLMMVILYEPRLYLLLACEVVLGPLMVYSMRSIIYNTIPVIILLCIVAVLLIELHFQRTNTFLSNRKLQTVLEEREKNADAIHATEMRHMIGNVAHDLKTPLASFTNGADLIKDILTKTDEKLQLLLDSNTKRLDRSESMSKTVNECFASIQNCLTNMRNTNAFMLMTINRCIDYTKASKGMRLVPKYETVDLREALQFPIECMSNIQERIGIKLETMSDEICNYIITDKQWLQENLLCLLSNAVKYSTEGNVTITATLNSKKPESANLVDQPETEIITIYGESETSKSEDTSYILFEIEDTGIGLSGEAMKSLFNPFKQAQRLAGGTGLGLYSLAKRVEALKGGYGVTQRKDGSKGSLFWFAIPYKADTSVTAARTNGTFTIRSASPKRGNQIERSQSNENTLSLDILIVDDAPSILKMCSMMLKRQGHQIWTAENGEIALNRIEEKWRNSGKGFDLVLMDLQMPVMDGLEATRRLRQMEEEGREWMDLKIMPQQCHVIFGVSANSDDETIQEAFQAGIHQFLAKPFSAIQFNEKISLYFID